MAILLAIISDIFYDWLWLSPYIAYAGMA